MDHTVRDPCVSRVAVFSHPNHELGILGLLSRLRPRIVYLTDGGGPERVEQTRRGLAMAGLLDRAVFFGHTEASFYEGLLQRDVAFFRGVARALRDLMRPLAPRQVLCDAVEGYNPVHDLALPLVRAALHDFPVPVEVLEVPLVRRRREGGEVYDVQRAPHGRRDVKRSVELRPDELETKVLARDRVYVALREQMGPLLTDLSRGHLAHEEVMPASRTLREATPRKPIRYEDRARTLLEQGAIRRAITCEGHWAPVAGALFRTR